MQRKWWIILLFLVGCQRHDYRVRHFPANIQCQEGCATLEATHNIELSAPQRQQIALFVRYHQHRPVLVSPCLKHASAAWTQTISQYLADVDAKAYLVKATMPAHPTKGSCVNLLAGSLVVHSPECRNIDLSQAYHRENLGCLTAKHRAASVINPYDLVIAGREGA